MKNAPECPVDRITVNENQVRITAALVCLFSLISIGWAHWSVPALLTLDFFLRSVDKGNASPLFLLAGFLNTVFSLGYTPVDKAPKRFAARIGWLFSVGLFISTILQTHTITVLLASVLVLFAFLESALGFCAGCHVYAFLKRLRWVH